MIEKPENICTTLTPTTLGVLRGLALTRALPTAVVLEDLLWSCPEFSRAASSQNIERSFRTKSGRPRKDAT